MVKSQQPQQILTTFKQKAPEKLATKKQNIQHIKHQREGRNIEQEHKQNITGKTPSTKPALIETKHYYNNLNKTFSKIIKKKQSNISDYKIEQKHNSLPPDLQPVLS